jgi:pSer/pThr/pTyr-binding forkhead associated (FHA) protein
MAFNSVTELMNMVSVFAFQQTRSGRTPLIVIENLDQMIPATLQCICDLAALKERHQFALRLALVSTRPPYSILNSMGMSPVAERLIDVLGLEPMSLTESIDYLYTSLAAATKLQPESILPFETCEKLHRRSGGWPGKLDRLAVGLIKNATSLPILIADSTEADTQDLPAQGIEAETTQSPMLVVTINGQIVEERNLDAAKMLLGRSERCDICMDDLSISKFHALIIRSDNGTSIVDLGSENGIYVNSEFSVDTQLRHLDVISIGSYRIKFLDSDSCVKSAPSDRNCDDTIALESADEIRRVFSVDTMNQS